MGKYFTKNNMKNWKWWIGMAIAVATIAAFTPFAIFGFIIDMLSCVFDLIHKKIDRFGSRVWRKIGRWMRS
ncbi:TMhelix containing protein [Vibrio phage 1.087.A._10N.261.45.F9]|nr:TMhelix containing protein [Vibrio phage 1.087.A._10N.261.45.F9]